MHSSIGCRAWSINALGAERAYCGDGRCNVAGVHNSRVTIDGAKLVGLGVCALFGFMRNETLRLRWSRMTRRRNRALANRADGCGADGAEAGSSGLNAPNP